MGNKDVRRKEAKKVKKGKRQEHAVNPIGVTQPAVEVIPKRRPAKDPEE